MERLLRSANWPVISKKASQRAFMLMMVMMCKKQANWKCSGSWETRLPPEWNLHRNCFLGRAGIGIYAYEFSNRLICVQNESTQQKCERFLFSKVLDLHIDFSYLFFAEASASTHLNTLIEVKYAQDYKFSLISWEQEQYSTHREQPLASSSAFTRGCWCARAHHTLCAISLASPLLGRSYYANVKYISTEMIIKNFTTAYNNKCIIAASLASCAQPLWWLYTLLILIMRVCTWSCMCVSVRKFSEHAASASAISVAASFTHTMREMSFAKVMLQYVINHLLISFHLAFKFENTCILICSPYDSTSKWSMTVYMYIKKIFYF